MCVDENELVKKLVAIQGLSGVCNIEVEYHWAAWLATIDYVIVTCDPL